MSPVVRRLTLSVHLAVSVGWIGAALAYLALGIAAATTEEPGTLRAAWIGMELTGWYVLVPIAVASLVTGLVMALGTEWGLFRHYWVVFSLILTMISVGILILHMFDVSTLADAARDLDADLSFGGHTPTQLEQGDLLHPAIGLVVLLLIQVMNVYKPRGQTRHGQRVAQRRAILRRPTSGQ